MVSTPLTVAYGDYNAPEIMEAVLFVLREAGAHLEIETIEVGQRIYNMGGKRGILPSSWDSLKRTKLMLKSPTTTPPENFEDVTAAILRRMELDESHRRNYQDDMATAFSYAAEHFALFSPQNATFQDTLLAAIMLLEHIGQAETAAAIRAAWHKISETADISAQELAKTLVAQLERKPILLDYPEGSLLTSH